VAAVASAKVCAIKTHKFYIYIALTAGDVEEVLSTGSIDLDVSQSNVVFVLAQRQITMLFAVETNKCLTVTSSLLAEAQRHTTSEHVQHNRRTIRSFS